MAPKKCTMTLNLNPDEMSSLEELAIASDATKTAVVRKAIRLYVLLNARIQKGERLFIEDGLDQKKAELLVL